jgi:deazaflavin-dependent oxidoreductase (nitroreductase family)
VGVAADLGYRIPPPSRLHRITQTLATTRPGAWVFARSLRHLDNVIAHLTHGNTSAPELLAGLPVLELVTTGRRSGRRRSSHLIAVPYGDTLALLGTNFGQPTTPAWVLNLEADPHATVTHHGATLEVVARQATADEQEEVLIASADVYRGYTVYQRRITARRLRIFLLEPSGG